MEKPRDAVTHLTYPDNYEMRKLEFKRNAISRCSTLEHAPVVSIALLSLGLPSYERYFGHW